MPNLFKVLLTMLGGRTRVPDQKAVPERQSDMVDEASDDSFPASDPPSYTGTKTAGAKH